MQLRLSPVPLHICLPTFDSIETLLFLSENDSDMDVEDRIHGVTDILNTTGVEGNEIERVSKGRGAQQHRGGEIFTGEVRACIKVSEIVLHFTTFADHTARSRARNHTSHTWQTLFVFKLSRPLRQCMRQLIHLPTHPTPPAPLPNETKPTQVEETNSVLWNTNYSFVYLYKSYYEREREREERIPTFYFFKNENF